MSFAAQRTPANDGTRPELEARLVASLHSPVAKLPTRTQLAQLDETDLVTIAARLNRFRDACGCAAGAASMIAVLCLGCALAFRSGTPELRGTLVLVLKVLGSALVAAIVGKVAGMLMSRARWRFERDRLFRRLAGAP